MKGDFDCDVLVCGLGPVGQLLALLLGRRGVDVIAIDQADGIYEEPRAAVVDDEVLRIFQMAGVDEQVRADSQVQQEVSFVTQSGRKVVVLRPVDGIHDQPPLVSINQPAIERTLEAALEGVPSVGARWRTRLERLDQNAEGVTAEVRTDEGSERIRARWAVGADGGTSTVRQLLGIEFGGSTFRQRWLVVDVQIDPALAQVRHPHFFGDHRRPIVSLPMSPGRHRWEWMLHPGEDPEPFLEPDSIVRRIEPWLDGERIEVERAVVYTFHARTAARWQEDRVLLAGDAAHLMPPFAGQGFSSGARDAANLAWKLEAVLRGAPQALIETYEAERRPHVRAMTRLALALGSFVQTTSAGIAALRDAYLTLIDVSGIAEWVQARIKPVPAYGHGAFAERPRRLAPKRSIGSQFPQPRVIAGGVEMPLDELLGAGWNGIAADPFAAEGLAAEGLRVLAVGRDFEDPQGAISEWLGSFDARWVVLRPDRFVFAIGSDAAAAASARDELHRLLGRATATTRTDEAAAATLTASA